MSWAGETPIEQVRFVVLDSETTGLNPRKDRIVTIGAIAVVNHEVLIEDSFEALLKVQYNSSAVTVHGVTREESLAGLDEPEALNQFLEYLGDGVIVGHHILHDIQTLERQSVAGEARGGRQ
ncbi:MAG: 3'-5' exonuclease, partial [Bryobacteraceae bacterium]